LVAAGLRSLIGLSILIIFLNFMHIICSLESQIKNKRREKLEDIDVNIEEKSHMTRTMKRKLQEENNIDAKKTNVLYVPLEKQISTPGKSLEDLQAQTPHQIRENEAEKRKELYLKSKADQKYLVLLFFIDN